MSLCFTLCLAHGYLPPAMIETTIVPIVKNKSGNLSDSSNYRLIAHATIVSKMFESVLLFKCAEYLSTSDNQFGFKSSHSTDLCIYTLKEFVAIALSTIAITHLYIISIQIAIMSIVKPCLHITMK